jgi:histidyl-tRNA synthetase
MATVESLNQEIAQQTALFIELRQQTVDPSVVEEAKKKLGELKKSLGVLTKATGGSKDLKKKERLLLKTAKVSAYTINFPNAQYFFRS